MPGLITWVTAAGVGGLARPLSGPGWVGLRCYLGFLLIPLFLLLLNVGLHLPLAVACRAVALAACVGGWVAWRAQRRDGWASTPAPHPIVVLPFFYLVLAAAVQRQGYLPSQWDEFSHWLLMPWQILLAGSPASPRLPYPHYADYTPGWPLALLYPSAVIGVPFDTSALLWLPFLSSAGVVAATYDVLRRLDDAGDGGTVPAWAGALVVATYAGAWLAPTHLLVEPPLETAWAALVLLAVLVVRRNVAAAFASLSGGIVLAGGFLLKKPFLAGLPLALVLCAPAGFRASTGRGTASAAWRPLFVFGPLALVATVWMFATRKVTPAFSLAGAAHRGALPGTATAMATQVGSLLSSHALAVVLVIVVLLIVGIGRPSRVVILAWGSSGALYLLALERLYATAAFPEAAGDLPGLTRYLSSIARVSVFLAVILAWIEIIRWVRPRPRLAFAMRAVSAVMVLVLSAVLIRGAAMSLVTSRAEDALDSRHMALVDAARQLRAAVRSRGAANPKVVAIDQEAGAEARFLRPLLRYTSLEDGSGAPYRLLAGPAFSLDRRPAAPGLPTTPTSPARFKRLLASADAIWPHHVSPWMRPVLRHLGREGGCEDTVERYFLVAPGRRRFACVPVVVDFHQLGLGFGQDHLYAYDAETLAARLTSAGFVDIAQRPYDPERDFRRDALHADARKPGQTE